MRILHIFTLSILLLWSLSSIASPIEFKSDHPQRYTVKKGDTLWGISAKFLKNPWVWPSVWHANPQVKNPHLIYPGDTISLVYLDGKPQLRIDRGRPTVKLSPKGRVQAWKKAVPTVPINIIKPFLSKPFILSKEQLNRAPYVVSPVGEHLITGAGDKIYVRGHNAKVKTSHFMVVREGRTFTDPKTNEILGYEAKYIGESKLLAVGDPATHYLKNTTREVLIGDRVMPAHQVYYNNFVPLPPKQDIEGLIIAVMDGVTQIGQHQVVIINKGKRDGMQVGHVMAVYQEGSLIRDIVSEKSDNVKLPAERAGIIMVFRTFDKMSYALVMKAKRNMRVMDIVKKP